MLAYYSKSPVLFCVLVISNSVNLSLTNSFLFLKEAEIVVEKYFNFDPKLSIPADICLIGCVFYLVEYDQGMFKMDDEKRKSVECNIVKYGGQLINEYNSKVTHVICESFSNSIVQRVSF